MLELGNRVHRLRKAIKGDRRIQVMSFANGRVASMISLPTRIRCSPVGASEVSISLALRNFIIRSLLRSSRVVALADQHAEDNYAEPAPGAQLLRPLPASRRSGSATHSPH